MNIFYSLLVSPDRSAIVEPNVYIAEHGEDVNFTCSAQGGPNNMFFWVRNASDACVDCSGQGDIAQFLEGMFWFIRSFNNHQHSIYN